MRELDSVSVVRLDTPNRHFTGSEGFSRSPEVGDKGVIVHDYKGDLFAVECSTADGKTVWLADFTSNEIEKLIHP